MTTPDFAETSFGRERLVAGSIKRRHRHARGYVAVVLSGNYVEAGDGGRWRVGPGDVLVHGDFDGHLDVIGHRGAEVLNLPLPPASRLPAALRVTDPDVLARIAETAPDTAAELLEAAQSRPALHDDWPDLLAAALRLDSDIRITEWASQHRLAPATVSRGFRATFGISPARYRVEARARRALLALTAAECQSSLADLALANGFADQAHLSRAIAALTGKSPSTWRHTSNSFKTAGARTS